MKRCQGDSQFRVVFSSSLLCCFFPFMAVFLPLLRMEGMKYFRATFSCWDVRLNFTLLSLLRACNFKFIQLKRHNDAFLPDIETTIPAFIGFLVQASSSVLGLIATQSAGILFCFCSLPILFLEIIILIYLKEHQNIFICSYWVRNSSRLRRGVRGVWLWKERQTIKKAQTKPVCLLFLRSACNDWTFDFKVLLWCSTVAKETNKQEKTTTTTKSPWYKDWSKAIPGERMVWVFFLVVVVYLKQIKHPP